MLVEEVSMKTLLQLVVCALRRRLGGVGPGQGDAGEPMVSQIAEHLEQICLCAGEGHAVEVGGEDAGENYSFKPVDTVRSYGQIVDTWPMRSTVRSIALGRKIQHRTSSTRKHPKGT